MGLGGKEGAKILGMGLDGRGAIREGLVSRGKLFDAINQQYGDRLRNISLTVGVVRRKTRSSADADNRLDAFSDQSRSTNMVPFHILHIVSYCAVVTLSLRYSSSKKFMTLKWGSKVTQGH